MMSETKWVPKIVKDPVEQEAIRLRVRERIQKSQQMTPEAYYKHAHSLSGWDVRPTTNDNPASFRRNYKYSGRLPLSPAYQFAERYDGIKRGIPRASYFRVYPDSIGLPIAERVVDGLDRQMRVTFDSHKGAYDVKEARASLEEARQSLDRGDWTNATQALAFARMTKSHGVKEEARKMLQRIYQEVRSYHHFAPASAIQMQFIDGGAPVTTVATISPEDQEFNRSAFTRIQK